MIGAFILNVGQPTLKEAIKSIQNQVDSLHIVSYVQPINQAINFCLSMAERFDWDYFLIFGADTIQRPNSVEIMSKYIKDDMWCVMGKLEDYYRDPGEYVNLLYNGKAVKGMRVSKTSSMYEYEFSRTMTQKGYRKVMTEEITGRHHPTWTTKESFEKYLFSGQRYPDKLKQKSFKQVSRRFWENPCQVNLAALTGLLIGISNPKKKLLTYEASPEWTRIKHLFKQEKLKW